MSRKRSSFSAEDVKRAIRTIEKAGKSVAGVDFPPEGGFRILIGEPSPALAPIGGRNEWDEVLSPQ